MIPEIVRLTVKSCMRELRGLARGTSLNGKGEGSGEGD